MAFGERWRVDEHIEYTMNKKYYTTNDILRHAGYDNAPNDKVRSAISRLSNLRRGEFQVRKRNSPYDASYRDKPTIIPPRLRENIDWLKIDRRVAYTQRGRANALRYLRP